MFCQAFVFFPNSTYVFGNTTLIGRNSRTSWPSLFIFPWQADQFRSDPPMTPVKTKSRGLLYILRSHEVAYFRFASLLALKVFVQMIYCQIYCPVKLTMVTTTQWLKDWIREAKACRFGWIFLSYSKQGLTSFILGIIWHLPPKTHKKYSADR